MVAEQAAILSQRLDVLLAEAGRLETELLTVGDYTTARDLACFALDLRLARRSLTALLHDLQPTPLRPLAVSHTFSESRTC
jgi:hypothetical protein